MKVKWAQESNWSAYQSAVNNHDVIMSTMDVNTIQQMYAMITEQSPF